MEGAGRTATDAIGRQVGRLGPEELRQACGLPPGPPAHCAQVRPALPPRSRRRRRSLLFIAFVLASACMPGKDEVMLIPFPVSSHCITPQRLPDEFSGLLGGAGLTALPLRPALRRLCGWRGGRCTWAGATASWPGTSATAPGCRARPSPASRWHRPNHPPQDAFGASPCDPRVQTCDGKHAETNDGTRLRSNSHYT